MLAGLPLNRYVIYPIVTVDTSGTVSFRSNDTAITFDSAGAVATRLEIMIHLPEQAILHKGKPAKPDATRKWAHALESKFPELTDKSDAELGAIIRRMRER